MVDIKAQKPAKRYADAFFEVISNKDYNRVLDEINAFLHEINTNDELAGFISHPTVSVLDKKEVISKGFNFSNDTLNFIFILLEENRLFCLDEIKEYLFDKINEKDNLKVIDITLAIEPDETLSGHIKQRLEDKFKSRVVVNFKKDESILGGMLVKVKDTVVDLSVRKKLENFKQL